MGRHLKLLFLVLAVILLSSLILPTYAEVTSLKTNTDFYRGGNKIYFSGSTLSTDSLYVTVVINDPNNQFVLLASGISNSNHTFQVTVDTGTQENQHKFTVKGIYNATAFVANKTSGKTVNFVFSPDGTAVVSSSPNNLKATTRTSSQIDLSWSPPTITGGSAIAAYKIERNDGSGFSIIQNTQTTSYSDTSLIANKQYSYRVSALNSAGTSNPSNEASATTLSAPTSSGSHVPPQQNNTTTQSQTTDTQSIEQLIQQRIENAKRLQELLRGKSNKISLSENVGIGDLVGNSSSSQNQISETKPWSPDFGTLLYPLIALAGIGVIVVVLLGKKNGIWFSPTFKSLPRQDFDDSSSPIQQETDSVEEDYSLMILKNRLAKGEITIEEYHRLKDALKEP